MSVPVLRPNTRAAHWDRSTGKGNHVRIFRRQLWVTCLAIGISVPTVVAVEANVAMADSTASLTTTVQISNATSDALTVRFTVRNTSSSTVNVLSRDLPQARQSGRIPRTRLLLYAGGGVSVLIFVFLLLDQNKQVAGSTTAGGLISLSRHR